MFTRKEKQSRLAAMNPASTQGNKWVAFVHHLRMFVIVSSKTNFSAIIPSPLFEKLIYAWVQRTLLKNEYHGSLLSCSQLSALIGSYKLQVLNNGTLAKSQSCTKSQVGVRVGVSFFQRSEVDNSSPVLNARRLSSAILALQISANLGRLISWAPPCSFLQSLIENYDFIGGLDVFKIQHCVNSSIVHLISHNSDEFMSKREISFSTLVSETSDRALSSNKHGGAQVI